MNRLFPEALRLFGRNPLAAGPVSGRYFVVVAKRPGRVVLLSLLLLLPLTGCGERGTAPLPLPAEVGDRAVFINYWAEWCAPCREEIPELNAFQREFAGDIVLYGVNFDGVTGEKLEAQEAAMGIEFPTLAEDPGHRLGWQQPEGLPYTLVIDAEGQIVVRLPGVQTRQSLEAALATFRQSRKEEP